MSFLMVVLTGCGDQWSPGPAPHAETFELLCKHEAAACEDCHPANEPLGPVDPACVGCHVEDRPASHDPIETATCEECHATACGWEAEGSPHPAGFAEPESHGLESNLQGPTEGDCRECHGADLRGGTTPEGLPAQGCDDCHAENDAPDWRTDCVFCHGGENDTSGAPPEDIDAGPISFAAHTAHVDADADYRALPCVECHRDHNDILTPDHLFDDSPGVAEVRFDRSVAAATLWDGNGSCGTNYCHGQGQRDDGVATEDGVVMDCESCHSTTGSKDQMSGLHGAHLDEAGIVCNDCHAAVIDRDGNIATAARHVDGARDVAFFEQTIHSQDGGGTCTGVCHGTDHATFGWGHPPGYEEPGLHGVDANLQRSDCGACHGADWTGGVAQGCDQCHADEGFPAWRTNCTFCHGGANGDTDGVPPEDIDGTDVETAISFGAHPEHNGTGAMGHPEYDCVECHTKPTSALSAGHALDGSPGTAEVDLAFGTSFEGGYDAASRSCSNLYCHGDGQTPSGTITDGAQALTCDSCHATTTTFERLSGTHAAHLAVSGVTCADCHDDVNASNVITAPARHVDRELDLDLAATGFSGVAGTCTIACHGTDHDGLGWNGNHPPGYEEPDQHGREALLRLQDCAGSGCHGADLKGAAGNSCDECHTAGWRADCTYCHGGSNGDTEGMPPTDVDGEADEARISFKAHPEHADGDSHPLFGCETCHASAGSYNDAVTDPGHWLVDGTATVAEVSFSGLAAGTVYAAGNCSNSTCHGNGQVRGASVDSATALDCNGCHSYDFDLGDLSGTHSLHLAEAGVTCADCHGAVADASGRIVGADQHVNGAKDVDTTATVGWSAASRTCTNTCHTHDHTAVAWEGGHPPGFDDPLVHGQEALFQTQDCATSGCHGTDLGGGASGQGCETCHTPNWRTDCNFCHGTQASGMPPSDLDNIVSEDQISFKAHPEHDRFGCDSCHGSASIGYDDAFLDVGHWLDGTPGVAEVDFSDGLSSAGTYNATSHSCSNLYCHGDGRSNGSETDSASALSCTGCHGMPPNSGDHGGDHDACFECHDDVNASEVITDEARHVDGTIDMGFLSGMNWNGNTCSGSCHGDGHSNENW